MDVSANTRSTSPVMPARASAPERGRAQRAQVVAALLAQFGGVVIMAIAVALGHANWLAVAVWSPVSMAFSFAVWLGLRYGWTANLPDPALTSAQIVWSITSAAVFYGMGGPIKMMSMLMALLALFFSIFALPARRVMQLSAYTMGVFAVVMAAMSHWQADRYPPADEALILLQFSLVLLPLAWLASRMSELRARLGRQKNELERALARIHDMAMRDELTGLFNRRSMVDELRQAQVQATRARNCCVAMLDIDHFKRINDQHGHAVGDAVLRAFAETAHGAVLGSDRLGRWGGEEFIVVFATGNVDEAAAGARRILESAAARGMALPQGGEVRFTVSGGLAVHAPGRPIEETLERADAALYEAKRQGRNRLVIAD